MPLFGLGLCLCLRLTLGSSYLGLLRPGLCLCLTLGSLLTFLSTSLLLLRRGLRLTLGRGLLPLLGLGLPLGNGIVPLLLRSTLGNCLLALFRFRLRLALLLESSFALFNSRLLALHS